MNNLTSSEWIEFFKWLVETDGGIVTLTAVILGLVTAVCTGIKQIRTAIVDFIVKIRDAIKGKKNE